MANYISKRGANVAPSYATTGDLPASTEVGDLVFVGGQLGIAVSGSGYQTCDKTDVVFPDDWTATTQQTKIQASDPDQYDRFGISVSIDGDTVVVGSYLEDAGGSSAGAAYVFTRSGTTWSQQAKLVASDAQAYDEGGQNVAIAGDTIVVAAPFEDTGGTQAGAVYVFTRSGTTWSQQAKIQASDKSEQDIFGISTAINGDTIVVGATLSYSSPSAGGAAYVFTRSGTSWSQQAKLQSSDVENSDHFGISVAIDGDTMVAGAYLEDTGGGRAGSAYVFTRSGTSWSQQAKLQASDKAANVEFGVSVAIDGDTIVAGAYKEDTGASDAGAVYVFTRSGTSWTQAKKVQAADAQASDYLGQRVGISGNTMVAGAYLEDTGGDQAGAAYTFVAG